MRKRLAYLKDLLLKEKEKITRCGVRLELARNRVGQLEYLIKVEEERNGKTEKDVQAEKP